MAAESFQLAYQPLFSGVGVVVADEVVGSQVTVFGHVVQDVPDDHDEGMSNGHRGFTTCLLAESAMHAAELGAIQNHGSAEMIHVFAITWIG